MSSPCAAALRSALLFGLALTLPACGGGGHSVPGPLILLDEQFNTFPNPDWLVSGSGTAFLDGVSGFPAPSLSTGPGGPSNASLVVESAVTVGGSDLTFSADVLQVDVGPGGGFASVVILSGTGALVAAADFDADTGDLTLTIGATSSPPLALAGGWHTVQFFFNATGSATWAVDGFSQLSVVGFFPPASMVISLENTSGSFFNFDTVVITSP
jgi:hypothetical protein